METFINLVAPQFVEDIVKREVHISNKNLPKIGAYHDPKEQLNTRELELFRLPSLLALRHLGAPSSTNNSDVIELGVTKTREYFSGDWIEPGGRDSEVMSKTPDNKDLPWFASARHGLLLCLLANDSETVIQIANWVESWMVPEPAAIEYDPMLGSFYLLLLASFRTEEFPGIEEVEASISKSRKKGPKLLYQSWQAVLDDDSGRFAESFHKSLAHFEKASEPPLNPFECIALDQTILLLAARQKGMALPELTELERARVITHESLGLPAP